MAFNSLVSILWFGQVLWFVSFQILNTLLENKHNHWIWSFVAERKGRQKFYWPFLHVSSSIGPFVFLLVTSKFRTQLLNFLHRRCSLMVSQIQVKLYSLFICLMSSYIAFLSALFYLPMFVFCCSSGFFYVNFEKKVMKLGLEKLELHQLQLFENTCFSMT